MIQTRELTIQTLEQISSAIGLLQVRWSDMHFENQSKGIRQDKTLASIDASRSIKALLSSVLARFHALRIHDARTGLFFKPFRNPHLLS